MNSPGTPVLKRVPVERLASPSPEFLPESTQRGVHFGLFSFFLQDLFLGTRSNFLRWGPPGHGVGAWHHDDRRHPSLWPGGGGSGLGGHLSLPAFFGGLQPRGGLAPPLAAAISRVVPASYVFEGMRSLLTGGTLPVRDLLMAYLLDGVYMAGAIFLYSRVIARARRRGFHLKLGS